MRDILFILIIVLALLTLQTKRLRKAVIYLCAFSLVSSLVYILYMAPDVALAESIIGSTLSTILFLVALKKYKIFRIYCTASEEDRLTPNHIDLISDLKHFAVEEEIELDIINTTHKFEEILEQSSYDAIIESKDDIYYIYGDNDNYHYENIHKKLNINTKINVVYKIINSKVEEEL